MDLPFTLYYLKESFKQAVAENPMKLYSGIFLLGDAVTAAYGSSIDSPLWSGAAALGLLINGNKFVFGKGGDKIDADNVDFTMTDAAKFAGDTVKFAAGAFTQEYIDDVCRHLYVVDAHEMKEKAKHIAQFWRYPLDAGWAAIATAGAAYTVDALDVCGFRGGNTSLSQAFMGAAISAGGALGFLTGNNALAGRMFTLATATCLYSGLVDQQWLLAASVPFYMMGNYIISKVKTDQQSSYTMAKKDGLRLE